MSTDEPTSPTGELTRLLDIMAALRTPQTGCPWDLEQTFATIAPYTIEEAYEVADAIARGDLADLKDELGDLLLQVVYHARMAEEQGAFAFADVARAVNAKMIRRHPHVFGTAEERAAGVQPDFWATMKAAERAEKDAERARLMTAKGSAPAPSPRERGEGRGEGQQQAPEQVAAPHPSPLPVEERGEGISSRVLADVPVGLPALTRAVKLQDKAARVGFDWPSLAPVFGKLKEELGEFEEVALPSDPRGANDPANRARVIEEYGDLLFVMANIARHLQLDPEDALRAANAKFTRRFGYVEARLADMGKTPEQSTLEEMDALWDEVRARDRKRHD